MSGLVRWLVVGAVGIGLARPAPAGFVTDARGDFLSTYTGPRGDDLDVLRADVAFDGDRFRFFTELAGPVGTTPGALYVWGLDRGQGTARFAGGSPPLVPNVVFDSVVVIRPDGTGQVNDLVAGTSTQLPASAIAISGGAIDAVVPAALLPTRGLAADRYTWNLWPRVGAGSNAQIADFAPDDRNERVSAAPEPASLTAMAVGGLLAVGIGRRAGRRPGAVRAGVPRLTRRRPSWSTCGCSPA